MTPTRYLILLAVVTVFTLLDVAQRTQVIHLGYHLPGARSERAHLADQNRRFLCDISTLSRPARIADAVERLDIALTDPVAMTQAVAVGGSAEPASPVRRTPHAR